MTNHLWQSTLFAAVAALLALALRNNRAQVRYWLWLSASLKFFVPFALLMSIGSKLHWAPAVAEMTTPTMVIALEQITQPFPTTLPPVSEIDWTPWILGAWSAGALTIMALRLRGWLRILTVVRASSPTEFPAPVEVRSASGLLEPGVVGMLRPILLVPAGIEKHLTPAQLDAVIAHELCHIQRRDNLFASIHMIAEAIFWFHPLVWWIGSRLVEERERACDEEVVRLGGDPRVYAEAIVSVCKLYVESPLTCVSGVTGADLKKRIEAIMRNRVASSLNFHKKVALSVAGLAALALPFLLGMLSAPVLRAQSETKPQFEVASIRSCGERRGATKGAGGAPEPRNSVSPGRLNLGCQTLTELLRRAYLSSWSTQLLSALVPISGGPAWIDSVRYSISAKAAEGTSAEIMQGPMMQALLEDRFGLKFHRETREGSIYALTISKGGSKLSRFEEQSCIPAPTDVSIRPIEPDHGGKPRCLGVLGRNGLNLVIRAQGATVADFTQYLAVVFNRAVVDRTGIAGRFDFQVEYSPDEATPGLSGGAVQPPENPNGVSIFTALEDQLGLKVESAKGATERFVIDSVKRPSEN